MPKPIYHAPCPLCGETFPKNRMKKHLQDHKERPLMFQPVRSVPKPNTKKTTKIQRAEDGVGPDFSDAVRKEIYERDGGLCVKCKSSNLDGAHHIIYKSQGGKGHAHNGVLVCLTCHDWAHLKRKGPFGEPREEGRKWFENYRITVLFPMYGITQDPYL